MADTNQDFQNTVEELFKGMSEFISSKTVVGEQIHVGDTILVPLVDVSFGIGAGANQGGQKNSNAGGGMGGKMTPNAILVISNGSTKLISVKDQSGLNKILDMVPDVLNKFTGRGDQKDADSDAETEK